MQVMDQRKRTSKTTLDSNRPPKGPPFHNCRQQLQGTRTLLHWPLTVDMLNGQIIATDGGTLFIFALVFLYFLGDPSPITSPYYAHLDDRPGDFRQPVNIQPLNTTHKHPKPPKGKQFGPNDRRFHLVVSAMRDTVALESPSPLALCARPCSPSCLVAWSPVTSRSDNAQTWHMDQSKVKENPQYPGAKEEQSQSDSGP